eukprot:COSAG06_NODE_7902_length_2337_cov_2.462913_2_plen_197_part_00
MALAFGESIDLMLVGWVHAAQHFDERSAGRPEWLMDYLGRCLGLATRRRDRRTTIDQPPTAPRPSSSAATLRARCGRPGGGGVLAAAGLVLCICAAALCAGDPDLGLRAIGIGHKLVLGLTGAALLRTAFARPFCRLAALGLAALRTAVAQAASRIAPRRLGDTVFFLLLYLKRHLFLNFSYVCPEPVLVKKSFYV